MEEDKGSDKIGLNQNKHSRDWDQITVKSEKESY